MDLISRKVAVKALEFEKRFIETETRKDGIDDAIDAITFVPSIPAVPLDKLCEWLAVCTDDPPCISLRFCDCGKVCREKKPSDAECWKTVITKWMEGLDATN